MPSYPADTSSYPNLQSDTPPPYFNETGPIYQKEHVQAKEFVNFVRAHVVVAANENAVGNASPEKETAWFDWVAFRAAVASLQASDISAEYDLTATIPLNADTTRIAPASAATTTTGSDVAETTIQELLDALLARFASTFTDVLFIPAATDAAGPDGGDSPRTYFLDALRKNVYHAFTHHLQVRDAPERCLSFYRCPGPGARSGWEYRLSFVHSDVRLRTVRGLVMTMALEGNFEDQRGDGDADAEVPWYGVLLDSSGPFSGALRAMQVVVGERFRCP